MNNMNKEIQPMSVIWVVSLRGATSKLRFFNKRSFDSFLDMLQDVSSVTVEVVEA